MMCLHSIVVMIPGHTNFENNNGQISLLSRNVTTNSWRQIKTLPMHQINNGLKLALLNIILT